MEIKMVNPNILTPHPQNPRVHPDSALKKLTRSITEFGWTNPVLVSKDGLVLAGHARLKAALAAGIAEVPVIYLDLEGAKAEAYMIADNKLQEETSWDMPLLKDLLANLEGAGVGLELTGFGTDELLKLLGPKPGQTDDDEIPEQVETICKTGDLWQLGNHKLLCGDATKKEDVERLMGEEKAVLMATDPPYGDSWVAKAKDMQKHGYGHSRAVLHGSIASDDLNEDDLSVFLMLWLEVAKDVLKRPAAVYVWHRAKRILFETSMLAAGYFVHQPIVWVKPSFVIGRLHYHPRCEWALHGWLKGEGGCPFYGERNQSDVWEVGRENDKLHPTQKPVALFEPPIRNHTLNGQICYEPFAGSGTQFIAAEKTGRRCFGIEIDEHYCDVIIQRWQNFTGKEAVKL